MKIAGLQKLSLLDYPGKTAATVFTAGCNYRCPYCHNADLVQGAPAARQAGLQGVGAALADQALHERPCDRKSPGGTATFRPGASQAPPADRREGLQGGAPSFDASVEDFLAFLEKRRGLLDGVCVTGGEALLQPGVAEFCAAVHERGFAVKLDTNGSFPDRLQRLVEAGVIDYVAMDVKNAPEGYARTVGATSFDLGPVRASIDYLMQGPLPYEFRTTVVRELHTAEDLCALARWIAGAKAWFLQAFIDADGVLAGPGRFHAWDAEDMRALLPRLKAIVPAVRLRGVD